MKKDEIDAELLTRLVALNRERAEEEKHGLIRWLRPEYQAPETVQPLLKPLFEVESEAVELTPAPAVEIQPWPKDLKEQLAALRALLLGSQRLWSIQQIGDAFKSRGRYREGISTQLDLLADLGVITRVETAEGPAFHRPQAIGGIGDTKRFFADLSEEPMPL